MSKNARKGNSEENNGLSIPIPMAVQSNGSESFLLKMQHNTMS